MAPNGNLSGNITESDKNGANLVFSNSSSILSQQAQSTCGTPIGNGNCGQDCIPTLTSSTGLSFGIVISPNPSTNSSMIQFKEAIKADVSLSIFNQLGSHIETIKIPNGTKNHSLNLPDPQGIYFLVFKYRDSVVTKKLIKQ